MTRVIDPADRRVARVTLTASGRRVLDHNRSLKNAFLAQQLQRLSPEERQSLGRADRAPRTLDAPEQP